MEKIESALEWIDNRVVNYLPLMGRVVAAHTRDEGRTRNAESLLRMALRTAFFLDFHSETGDKDFLDEANRYKQQMYASLPPADRQDLERIEGEIIKLFDYEKQIWAKVSADQRVSNEEIERFWKMKSADSLFYGRILKIFTEDKDFTAPLYVYTQILDGVHDVTEYEKDFQGRLPNLLYMKLSQKMRPRNIPSSKKEAVAKAIHLGCYSELEDFVEARAGEVSSFNFGNCVHLKQAIEEKRREFHSEAVSP